MKTIHIYFAIICLLFTACTKELEQSPESTASKESIFGTVSGLETYVNSFYEILPSANSIVDSDDLSDYGAVKAPNDFLRAGAYGPQQSSGWDWGNLRNINFFIANCTNPKVNADIRKEYIALARFFRAWFYFDKVKRFGDVPWINYPMDVADPALYNERDSRFMVMDSVLADINYACQHITKADDNTRSLITKWVAYGLKSRICLYEGSIRKYHTRYNQQSTANAWFAEAAAAAREVMAGGYFSLNDSYRALFNSEKPVAKEVMQSAICDLGLSVFNDANWTWTSATFAARFSFTRTFIHTYLNEDGTPFTNTPGYQTKTFMEEVKNRDNRLQQTIRMAGYKMLNGGVMEDQPPAFSYTYTGYQPIKWVQDDFSKNQDAYNTNSICRMRYAEMLLNYAEAKAEMGTLTDEDWAETIGALRKRAGITGGLNTKPTIADQYLVDNYFSDITDPVLLEIRRERGIELSLEGFRFGDIVRWHVGELMTKPWNGFYVPALDTPLDLDENGVDDVYFTTSSPGPISDVYSVNVSRDEFKLSNGTSGELLWYTNIIRTFEEKNYLYPIPESDRLINPALGQNPGW